MRRTIVPVLFVLYVIWISFISWNAVINILVTVPEVLFLTAISFLICQTVAIGTPWPKALAPISIVLALIVVGITTVFVAMHTDIDKAIAYINPLFHGYVLTLFIRYFLYRRNLYKSIVVKDKRKIEGFGS